MEEGVKPSDLFDFRPRNSPTAQFDLNHDTRTQLSLSSGVVPFVDGSNTSPSSQPDCTGKKGKAAVVVSAVPAPAPPPRPSIHPTRALLLSFVPTDTSESSVRRDLEVFGDVRAVQTAWIKEGFVAVHFYNLRAAHAALEDIREQHMLQQNRFRLFYSQFPSTAAPPPPSPAARGLVSGRAVWAQFISPALYAFPDGLNQGTLVVGNLNPYISASSLVGFFAPFGPIRVLWETPTKGNQKFVEIEFYDVRDAVRALGEMNGREIGGKEVAIEFSRPGGGHTRGSVVPPFDLLGLRPLEGPKIQSDLIDGRHDIVYFPTLEDVEFRHDREVKETLVLRLRGCDQLFLPTAPPFPFEKYKTLISLEISSCTHLTTLPENTVSKMTQLRALNLSHLPIHELPDDLFSNLTQLRSLVLQGCSNLQSLPNISQLLALEYLEFSYLLIETFPKGFFPELEKLERLILRECSRLRSFPSTPRFNELKVFDLSHCIALQENKRFEFCPTWLFDLSYTALPFSSTIGNFQWVTHLFLRDAKVIKFEGLRMPCLMVLDVSGAQRVEDLDELKKCSELVALDLSRTGVESIAFISGLVKLHYLILRECTRLQKLPTMEELTRLEVLDISRTLVEEVPNLSNLINLKQFFSADCHKLKGVPEGLQTLTNLETLDCAPSGSSEINFIEDPRCRLEGRLSKPDEFYHVYTLFGNSGFDRFRRGFDQIVGRISKFQENFKPTSSVDTIFTAMIDADNSQSIKRLCRKMLADLEYIRANISLLESCPNRTSAEELLDDLKHKGSRKVFDSRLDLTNFDEFLRVVAKLKLLIPPKQVDDLQKKKDKKRPKKNIDEGEGDDEESDDREIYINMPEMQSDVTEIDINRPEMQNLSRSYDSLTDIQKNCLLYFTIFQTNQWIKEMTLIHLWYGEGLIDLQRDENVAAHSKADSTPNPRPTPNQNLNLDLTPYSNPNPEFMSISTEAGQTRNDANPVTLQVSTAKGVKTAQTIEEIGREILMVLEKKKFIFREDFCYRDSRLWTTSGGDDLEHFLRVQAKEEPFVNFDEKNGKLTPYLRPGSKRACLVQSQDNLPSSCTLWANCNSSSENLARLKNIRTLLNVNEPMVDIRAEWFSKMRKLSVLHLSMWHSEKFGEMWQSDAVEVKDLKFLEELKNMKKLRVLSLEGFFAIKKLPESVRKLTNLKILNLRECRYLEELPAGIGALKNLSHLDLTDCGVLSYLPKGIGLLSKLEVLKGFVITYQIGGQQHRNACTLAGLLKLEKLRKLTLVVH